MIKANKDND